MTSGVLDGVSDTLGAAVASICHTKVGAARFGT